MCGLLPHPPMSSGGNPLALTPVCKKKMHVCEMHLQKKNRNAAEFAEKNTQGAYFHNKYFQAIPI